MIRRARVLAPCFIAFVLLSVSPALAAKKTVPHSEYQALIRECRSFLSNREIDPVEAKKLGARLRDVGTVTLPTGQNVAIDTKPEADALDAVSGTTPDKKLAQRFAALDEQIATTSQPTPTDPRLITGRILRANEFKDSQPEKVKGSGWDWSFFPKWMKPVENTLKPVFRWFGKIFSAIGKWLGKGIENIFRAIGKFFRWIFNRFPQAKWNAKNPFASLGNNVLLTLYFLATVAGVVGVYFLSRYLFDLYEIRTGRKRRAAGVLGGDLDLSAEGITDPLGTAKERAATGDYRSAIRLTYIASLWKLGEGGILTLEKNRTNWEYQRSLRKQAPSVHEDLLPATRLFDRIWYGKQPGTESEFRMISDIYDKLPTEPESPPTPNSGGAGGEESGAARLTNAGTAPVNPPAPPELEVGGLSEIPTDAEGERP